MFERNFKENDLFTVKRRCCNWVRCSRSCSNINDNESLMMYWNQKYFTRENEM